MVGHGGGDLAQWNNDTDMILLPQKCQEEMTEKVPRFISSEISQN